MANNSADNSINETKEFEYFSHETIIICCILYSLIALIGTVGNMAVIVVILKRRLATQARRPNPSDRLIVCLAVTDLLSSIAIPLCRIYTMFNHQWWHGAVACALLPIRVGLRFLGPGALKFLGPILTHNLNSWA